MLKMNYWGMKGPARQRVSLRRPLQRLGRGEGVSGKTIYHFGTGTHTSSACVRLARQLRVRHYRVEGRIRQHIALVTENARVAKSYLAYFGDIYLTNARLLPISTW
jgi:hypothetical protein